jgi:prolyl oligopeptidase
MRSALPAIVIAITFFGCAGGGVLPEAPEARRETVVDAYHGTEVAEDYRWLEDWDDPEVKAWSEAQNVHARGVLGGLPGMEVIRARVAEILESAPVEHYKLKWLEGRLFALRYQPPMNQPFLVVIPSPDEPEAARVIVDPNQLDPSGSTSIDWYEPSPDGSVVAVSLSVGGSESGDVHFYETETGQETGEVIPRVNGGTAGGDLAWTPDGSGFLYTRYPRDGERPPEDSAFYQQLWFHAMGTPAAEDRRELGEDLDKIAEIVVEAEPGTGRYLATVQYGDSGQFAHHVRELDGSWNQITRYGDGHLEVTFGPHGSLFVVSRQGAPRGKILRLPSSATPIDRATEIIPEGDDTIVSQFDRSPTMVVGEARLYLVYQLGGPSIIRVFDHDGRPLPAPSVPPVSRVGLNMVRLDGEDLLFSNTSYIDPTTWYRFQASDGTTSRTALFVDYPVSFEDTEVVRDFTVSKDGTRIPINIIRRKGIELDGSNPVLLNGYGGFGLPRTPRFSATRRIWLDHGGVYAVANIRGGGEYGEEWHRAGTLTRKQNVFDDFSACMRYLVEAGYTTPERLVIEGGSNGGLLMGAMLVQHPEAARTVVSHVGIYDMLRVELSSNGRFNIPEYGTVEDPDQFEALYAYSPYHNVEDGVSYPAVLFLTGANDPRVDPMQSRKMTARLQAATSSGLPILLRTSADTGHGGLPLSEIIEQIVDVYGFMFDQLGIEVQEQSAGS